MEHGTGGIPYLFQSLRKIGNFTYRMWNSQGKIAMDGDFRRLAARMPHRLRPERFEAPKYILLVKSDFEMGLEKIRYAACAVFHLPPMLLSCPALAGGTVIFIAKKNKKISEPYCNSLNRVLKYNRINHNY